MKHLDKKPSDDLPEIGYYDLLRDLERPGCAVCRGSRLAARKRIASILCEYVNDQDVRSGLRASYGFCRGHTFWHSRKLAIKQPTTGSPGSGPVPWSQGC